MTPAPADTPEAAVLLATARVPGSSDAAAREAIARGPDWTALVAMALHHGTAGLLCRRVLAAAHDSLPEELRAAMGAYLESCAARHRLAVAELLEVLDVLAQDGVRALPFKGPALAALAWAEPALRPCQDLDLLLRPDEVEPALAALGRLGFVSQHPGLRPHQRMAYHRYNGQDCLVAPGRAMAVEPHWALAPRTLAIRLDTAALIRRARPVALEGRVVPTLSAEDALLVAGLHGAKEEWTRLVWAADIAALLAGGASADLDAKAVLARAAEAGMRRMLLTGIALAMDLLGAPCHGAFAAALADDPGAWRLAAQAAARLWRCETASSVFALSGFRWRMRDGLGDRLRYVAATLLTARVQHLQAVDLPPGLRGLYPLVRVGQDFVALPLWRLMRARRGA